VLTIQNLTYRIDGRPLFEAASAFIAGGWKVGLVGRNGAGKSTLLRLVRGEIAPDAGDVSLARGKRIGWLEQEAPASRQALLDIVVAFDLERQALYAELELDPAGARVGDIHERLTQIDAHSAEARAASILAGLGFSAAQQKLPASDFSGGWRMRVALAGVLFSSPDLLLLDEPTNYLDIEGAIWLESYLRRYPHTAIIVSHDREFLNKTTTHILALENRSLTVSAGDFDTYERRRSEARMAEAAFRAKQDAARAHMQSFIDRFRAKASKARQAQSRIKALQRMTSVIAPTEESAQPIRFKNPEPLSPPIIRLVDSDLGYAQGAPVLRKVNLRIDDDDRIVVLGPNGEGKSTLVKSLSGRLALLSGDVVRHRKLKVAYFAQHQLDELDADGTPLSHVRKISPAASEAQVRAIAASFGFGAEKVSTKVSHLSGGEKARLLLGLITHDGPHLIVLDEPTNHLDMDARESLAIALNDYSGAVIMITHDAYLASAVADRLILVKDGAVRAYEGDLDDYRALVLATNSPKESQVRKESPLPAIKAPPSREAIAPLEKAADTAAAKLDELNAILPKIDAALAVPNLYANDRMRAIKLQKERSALLAAIARAEENWLAAIDAVEAAKAARAAAQ
jgi:ATP-binding cassette subfamily F protein 3